MKETATERHQRDWAAALETLAARRRSMWDDGNHLSTLPPFNHEDPRMTPRPAPIEFNPAEEDDQK